MNYYQFHIADFALHTGHLTLEEECVYRRLLDYYYDTESAIPEETDRVIRRLRLKGHEDTVALILDEFFVLQADGWHNLRADVEIADYNSKAERARENGKKGGRPKKNKGSKTQSVIVANPEITGSKANQEPVTINQEPNNIDTNVSIVGTVVPPCPHLEIIELYNRILPELQQVVPDRWGGARAAQLKTRWRESKKHQSLRFWERFFSELRNHPFYMGENDRGWSANLGWIIKRENFDKLIEKFTSESQSRREAA